MGFTLQYYGIYPDAIISADESGSAALREYGLEQYEDDAAEYSSQILGEFLNPDSITNSVIQAIFEGYSYIFEKYRPKLETDYYVNGDDSHFIVNGQEC